LLQTFGVDPGDDPGSENRFMVLVDRAQAWAVFDGNVIAGTAATFKDLSIGIPGGSLPIAGLTMVTVRPTHRRRGLLRDLMKLHLDDARRRGFGVSGLWASEASIYGRFGYGIAAEHDAIKVKETHTLQLAATDVDQIEWIDETRARGVLPDIYARATADRPGALRRTDVWWSERRFLESPWSREGASLRRHVLAKRGDTHVGYIAYRQRQSDGPTPGGKTSIIELHGIDPRAEATLWRFALSMDLFHEVSWPNAPTDAAIPFLVNDPRRIERRRADNLWLRIEDVPAALSARRYTSDGVLRFTIEGTSFELAVEGGQAHCTQTARAAELDIDRIALGSLYLGGFAASRLARANLVRGDARALATADRLFAWPIAPWCPEIF
jgi:predicted acetyltransferase